MTLGARRWRRSFLSRMARFLDGLPASVADEIGAAGLRLDLLDAPCGDDRCGTSVRHRSERTRTQASRTAAAAPSSRDDLGELAEQGFVPTDISEDVVGTATLSVRLVDVKASSVDDIWSRLKLVIRKEHR